MSPTLVVLVVVTQGSSRNIFGFKKEKTLKELLEKDARNSNDFLEVFNYSSEVRERERDGMMKIFLVVRVARCFLG